jgi:uncharacterized protein
MTHFAIARAVLVLALLLVSGTRVGVALAQTGDEASVGATQATITVSGRGEATAEPDMAVFTAGVETVSGDLGSAQSETTQRMTAVLDALRQEGVADEAIQTVGFRVEVVGADAPPPQPIDATGASEPAMAEPAMAVAATSGPPEMAVAATPGLAPMTGFRVVNEVRVEVADLDRLGAILDTVVAAGANTVSGIELTVEDPSDAQREARMRAVADAQDTADDLAMAAGGRLGDVLAIATDGVAEPPVPVPVAAEAQAAGGAVPIAPGQNEFVVEVRVTYALLPEAA